MGTQNIFLFGIWAIDMGYIIVSLSKKIVVCCYSCLFTVFGCLRHSVFRFKEWYKTLNKSSDFMLIQSQEDGQSYKGFIEQDKNDEVVGEDQSESFLRFRFPTYEEFINKNNELVNVEGMSPVTDEEILRENSTDVPLNVNSSDDSVHVEDIVKDGNCTKTMGCETKTHANLVDFPVHGSTEDIDANVKAEIGENLENFEVESEKSPRKVLSHLKLDDPKVYVGNIIDKHFGKVDSGAEIFQVSYMYDVVGSEVSEDLEEIGFENGKQKSKVSSDLIKKPYYLSDDDDDESLVSDSDSDSIVSSFRSSFLDSISDGFMSDIEFEKAFEELEVESTKEFLSEEDIKFQNLMTGYEADDFADEDDEILGELNTIEESITESRNITLDQENGDNLESKSESLQNVEKPNSGEQSSSNSDEQNELEREWEHQDLVEQLKMEIRKVRAIGLPTILEESESPKIADDLKPWKIEEKFQQEGTLDELVKFYKSYRERMRKLDIFNYQKMYAIGFLRLKDPLQSFTEQKFSNPALATIVSLNCWPLKFNSGSNIQQQVMKKYSRELECDLEMVYVGQMCLSWEFLHWEYGKALELWDSDPHGIRHYNDVAEKFQQFQVLLTRFIEDDPFQRPRVQHYVKTRCVLRNLLQVPLIRADNMRDKKKGRIMVSGKDAITSIKLVEMIEESIRVFWHFVRTDKDTSSALLMKCRKRGSIELQNPDDADLFAQVQTSLHQKEKKLKELSRSRSCILKKFRTNQEDESDHVLYFFSQVDMRLVHRVLNMSRITTDQLVWCCDKLSRIKFSGRKLLVEPSVLLFPCT